MKILKNLGFLLITLIAFKANAQTDKATTIRIVEAKKFLFVATSALPLNSNEINSVIRQMPGSTGGNINLSGSNYDLKITADSLVAYLPYYGRSYSAPVNRDDNGFKFTAKDFTYTSKKNKRGWDVSMEPKDVRDNVRMNLSISESGYASLSVMSNSKQSITYNGYISEIPVKKIK